jgi:hypothetical protein
MQARLDVERAFNADLERRHHELLASTDAAAAAELEHRRLMASASARRDTERRDTAVTDQFTGALRIQSEQIRDLTDVVNSLMARAPAPPPAVSYSAAAAAPALSNDGNRRRTIEAPVINDDLEHQTVAILASEWDDMPHNDTVPRLTLNTDLEDWRSTFQNLVTRCPNPFLRGHLARVRMGDDLRIPVEAELSRLGIEPGDMVTISVMMRVIGGAFDAARPSRHQAAVARALQARMKKGKFDVYVEYVVKNMTAAGIDVALPRVGSPITARFLAGYANFLRLVMFTGMEPYLLSELTKIEGIHNMPFSEIRKIGSRLDSSLSQQRASAAGAATVASATAPADNDVTWDTLENGEFVGYVGGTSTRGKMDDATFRKPWDNVASYVKANPTFQSCRYCLKNKGSESKSRIANASGHSAPFCEHLYLSNVGSPMTAEVRSRVIRELKTNGYQLPGESK